MIKDAALVVAGLLLAVVFSTAGPLFHLEQVKVQGDTWAVAAADVRAGLSASGSMSLVFGQFDRLAEHVASLSQVRAVSIAKDYPDRLVLNVEGRAPVARAAAGGLIDSDGTRYEGTADRKLPIFAVEPHSLPQAVELYLDTRAELATLGLGVNQLHSDQDGWRVFVSNGWVLLLGQSRLRERLARFARTWPGLQQELGGHGVLRVDLRYPHGMAVAGALAQEDK